MWSEGSRTLLGSTKLSRRTFLLHGTRDVLLGHTFLVQRMALSRLSHSQRKQGYFVFPPCCPSRIEITFKSPHMVHAWSLYLILLRIKSKFSYLSFKCTECPTGNDAYLFPLCRRTALKLLLDESINSLHSLASCWMLNLVISPGMSLQYTSSPSWEKNGTNSFSLLYHEKVVLGASKFFCFSLEPSNSADSFGRHKSWTKSFSSVYVKSWGLSLAVSNWKSLSESSDSLAESFGVSRVWGGWGMGMSGPWGNGRIADGRFG